MICISLYYKLTRKETHSSFSLGFSLTFQFEGCLLFEVPIQCEGLLPFGDRPPLNHYIPLKVCHIFEGLIFNLKIIFKCQVFQLNVTGVCGWVGRGWVYGKIIKPLYGPKLFHLVLLQYNAQNCSRNRMLG